MNARHLLLGVGLAATAAAALWLPPAQAPDVVQAAPRQVRASEGAGTQPRPGQNAHVLALRPRAASGEGSDSAFDVRQWHAPPPPPAAQRTVTQVVAVAPAPAQAPAAPFKVIGRYEEAGRLAVFLEHQQATLVARAGDQLTPDWKVQSIDAGRLVLQYLPLSQTQVLEWASP